jgi:hypothetical protein
MVREIGKKIKRFSLEDSDALEENERILAMGSQLKKENDKESKAEPESVAISSTEAPTVTAPVVPAKKTTNGIVVDVPIDDYMALMQMKVMTRRTLKDLALQAIHEFVERNK